MLTIKQVLLLIPCKCSLLIIIIIIIIMIMIMIMIIIIIIKCGSFLSLFNIILQFGFLFFFHCCQGFERGRSITCEKRQYLSGLQT